MRNIRPQPLKSVLVQPRCCTVSVLYLFRQSFLALAEVASAAAYSSAATTIGDAGDADATADAATGRTLTFADLMASEADAESEFESRDAKVRCALKFRSIQRNFAAICMSIRALCVQGRAFVCA